MASHSKSSLRKSKSKEISDSEVEVEEEVKGLTLTAPLAVGVLDETRPKNPITLHLMKLTQQFRNLNPLSSPMLSSSSDEDDIDNNGNAGDVSDDNDDIAKSESHKADDTEPEENEAFENCSNNDKYNTENFQHTVEESTSSLSGSSFKRVLKRKEESTTAQAQENSPKEENDNNENLEQTEKFDDIIDQLKLQNISIHDSSNEDSTT